ncbi:hypothetical protein BJX76DRAFT_367938 [Aspergillus varians]
MSHLDPAFRDLIDKLVVPQVDGAASRRKMKKMERPRNKKKKARNGDDNVNAGGEGEKIGNAEKEKPNGEGVKYLGVPMMVFGFGDRGRSKQVPRNREERYDHGQEQALEQAQEEAEAKEQKQAQEQDREQNYEHEHQHEQERNYEHEHEHKQEHGQERAEKQAQEQVQEQEYEQEQAQERHHVQEQQERHEDNIFNEECCVHKPAIKCGCPPRYSCCCMHHAGDCCHCHGDETVTQDEGDSKTLSLASYPATPPSTAASVVDADNIAAPATPSNVELMVTPASPTPLRNIERVAMGGAEDADTFAVQANLELSNALIEMMNRGHMSDIKLVLRSSNDQFWPIIITGHKCVLARSPLITSLLASPYYTHEIEALAGEHFTMIKPWEQVVHYLYGKPVLTLVRLKPVTLEGLGYDPFPTPGCEPNYPFCLQSAMMDMALGYAVCSAFFYLPDLVNVGFRLAMDLLSWETVEHVVYFGLYTYKFAVILPTRPWLEDPGTHCPRSGARDAAQGEQATQKPDKINSASDPKATAIPNPAPAPVLDSGVQPYEFYPVSHLQCDWSHRLITAALGFIADNIKPGFKLDCQARSDIVPDRIPEFLKTAPAPPPPSTATTGGKETKNKPSPSPSSSAPPSAAVANNPRLADVKFGSFDTKNTTTEATTQQSNKEKNNRTRPLPLCPAPNPPSPLHKREKSGAISPSSGPGLEITIPSAVLLTLGFYELHLAFTILATRGVLTSPLAQEIILEREARRIAALQNYAARLVAADSAAAGSGSGSSSAKSRKKARAKAKKAGKNGVDPNGVAVNFGDIPGELRELCYREFFSSRLVGQGGKGHGSVQVEIVLEREWVGLEC